MYYNHRKDYLFVPFPREYNLTNATMFFMTIINYICNNFVIFLSIVVKAFYDCVNNLKLMKNVLFFQLSNQTLMCQTLENRSYLSRSSTTNRSATIQRWIKTSPITKLILLRVVSSFNCFFLNFTNEGPEIGKKNNRKKNPRPLPNVIFLPIFVLCLTTHGIQPKKMNEIIWIYFSQLTQI